MITTLELFIQYEIILRNFEYWEDKNKEAKEFLDARDKFEKTRELLVEKLKANKKGKNWIKVNNIAMRSLDQIIRVQNLGIVDELYSSLLIVRVWFSDGGEIEYAGKEATEFLRWFAEETGIKFSQERR